MEIEKAVSEICRVVKPGGRIAIIDKNAEHWGRLKTPEWEKWFTRKELERLLRRDCREVSSRLISYWEDVEPDGLFCGLAGGQVRDYPTYQDHHFVPSIAIYVNPYFCVRCDGDLPNH